MRYADGMNIVLIGYRGSGKSAVGQALAAQLGWPLIDTDTLIEQRAGTSIREIFSQRGEMAFRDLETQVIADLAPLDAHIISAGGGAVLRPANVQTLRPNGKFVWLTAPPEVLRARMTADTGTTENRPNLTAAGGLAEIRQVLTQREPIYRQVADFTVDTTHDSIEDVAQRIILHWQLK